MRPVFCIGSLLVQKDCVRVRNPAMNTSCFSFHAVSSHLSEAWLLRSIQGELERMPRFTVFQLFELGRHCILPMGSLVLTYVIIIVQFAVTNQPVTCKTVS
ncbi:hypothetical protein FHG87_017979 [Trinorchestia longiramus]|nr:hypothetical protein FHG87_017979 [Trinorchestia longiramus]